jgi:hypothetical protein
MFLPSDPGCQSVAEEPQGHGTVSQTTGPGSLIAVQFGYEDTVEKTLLFETIPQALYHIRFSLDLNQQEYLEFCRDHSYRQTDWAGGTFWVDLQVLEPRSDSLHPEGF